ncbi:MAG: hypothetical protein CVV27_16850 [Candidatus Melainabacteria bacterium HGW-Melainabacteria-1]|nr:MAG: hypothetical protein CVV27_16850 [Candidatus Melainabacteria bacterium HGW-Melainabacteria-1]
MKKLLIITLSLSSLTLIGCGQVPSQNAALPVMRMSAAQTQARSLNLAKPTSQTLKAGSPELGINQAKGQLKPVAPFDVRLEAVRRDLGTNEVMAIARIGLDGMERAKTYEDGYNIGRSTLESLSRHNAYIARLALAATNPEMKYESAYKAASKALAFIANNREITIYNACDLVRDMMTAAKTWPP